MRHGEHARDLRGLAVVAVLSLAAWSAATVASMPPTHEEVWVELKEWVDQSDVVACADVISLEPPFRIGRTLGDWIFALTGRRMGFSDDVDVVDVHVERAAVLKGPLFEEALLSYGTGDAPRVDWPFKERIEEGHRYLFFGNRTAAGRIKVSRAVPAPDISSTGGKGGAEGIAVEDPDDDPRLCGSWTADYVRFWLGKRCGTPVRPPEPGGEVDRVSAVEGRYELEIFKFVPHGREADAPPGRGTVVLFQGAYDPRQLPSDVVSEIRKQWPWMRDSSRANGCFAVEFEGDPISDYSVRNGLTHWGPAADGVVSVTLVDDLRTPLRLRWWMLGDTMVGLVGGVDTISTGWSISSVATARDRRCRPTATRSGYDRSAALAPASRSRSGPERTGSGLASGSRMTLGRGAPSSGVAPDQPLRRPPPGPHDKPPRRLQPHLYRLTARPRYQP